MRAEGAVDAGVWTAAAVASTASTAAFSAGGYPMLAIAAGSLALLTLTFLLDPRNPGPTHNWHKTDRHHDQGNAGSYPAPTFPRS